MRLSRFNGPPLGTLLISATLLSACGGGTESKLEPTVSKSSSDSAQSPIAPLPATVPATTAMTMACSGGSSYQCSGDGIVRSDNGVALTSSGVQVYGKSTSDLANPIVLKTTASGFAPASGGIAEFRVAKDGSGALSAAALLLSNLGISWDGKHERPMIIETFQTTQGRVELGANGALAFTSLPDTSHLGFYDFALKGVNGTQANYANNRYFPRSGNPSRCPPGVTPCPAVETHGLHYRAGDWRAGGGMPDWTDAGRVHSDGDVHAGEGLPDANGNATVLPGGTGPGVPFPGSKGYRSFANWSLRYGNLGVWVTQDTVLIEEWAAMSNEHNKNRRGVVAFGDVSDPGRIPEAGSATYSGIAYGWYARNAGAEPSVFHGTASLTVNFATRQAVVTLQNTTTYDASSAPVPVALTAYTGMGAAGANVANYLTGSVDNGVLKGGLSGRYFGPITAEGSGTGPAEAGGAFSLSNPATGETAIGGFIARKQ